MIRNLATPMAILMLAALTSGAVLLIRTFRWDARASVVWTTAGWGLLAAALVVTLAVNVPIDSEIQYWTLSSLPENWRELRDRWEFYHGLREHVLAGTARLLGQFDIRDIETTVRTMRSITQRAEAEQETVSG